MAASSKPETGSAFPGRGSVLINVCILKYSVLNHTDGTWQARVRVVIADNHPLVADALTQYLRSIDPKVEVAAATTLRGALGLVGDGRRTHLILLDPQLSGAEGLEGLIQVHEAFPLVPVVILTGSRDLGALRQALQLGAAGVIPKEYSATAIIKALELILLGERYVPAKLLKTPELREAPPGYQANDDEDREHLSLHERRVLRELAKGGSNAEIGVALNITAAGVAYHLKGIFKKLGVRSRGQAIARFHEMQPLASGFL